MAYKTFTDQVLFEDVTLNVQLNSIMDKLLAQDFNGKLLSTIFCITGTVAKIIQGDPPTDIKVMPFITDDALCFEYCNEELPKVTGALGAVKFKDRVQITFENLWVEIWLSVGIGTINTVTGLQVQDPADIPAYIN